MKKLTIITSALTAMVSVSAMAQGYFNGGNSSSTAIMIQDTRGVVNAGVAVKVGVPANTAGFVGAGPGQITIDLFAFAGNVDFSNPSSVTALLPGGTNPQNPFQVLNNTTAVAPAPSQGTFLQVVNPTTLPTAAGFDGSGPITLVYYAFNTGNTYTGFEVAHITPAVAGSAATAPAVFGTGAGQIGSLVLTPVIPEPTTLALGGLGAAALLLFRRRK